MFGEIEQAVEALRSAVGKLEPGCFSGPDASRLVKLFAEGERLCAAGRALAARRVECSNHWRKDGFRSAAHWMAARTATTVGQAVGTLETARKLEPSRRRPGFQERAAVRTPSPGGRLGRQRLPGGGARPARDGQDLDRHPAQGAVPARPGDRR